MAVGDGNQGGPSPVEPRVDPLIGTVINGKFKVERAIARGGMGRIYLALQAPLGRPVALKVVKADSTDEEGAQFLKRFLLEASILAKLQHPNVVTLFDYGRVEGAPSEMYFIAMEFLDGETLSDRLREGALAAHEAVPLLGQIARGLREAHSFNIIHRDLKPSNIVIIPETGARDAEGVIVKIVDFGIGKVDAHNNEDLTQDGVLVGTPKYMAPEQFEGQACAGSDVYALGTIAYQCLTGVLPFPGISLHELMVAKLQRDVPPMRSANPICDASESLEELTLQMLARRPEARPTLDEVFAGLRACEEEIFGGPRGSGIVSRPSLGFPSSSRSIDVIGSFGQPSGAPTQLLAAPEGPTRITGVTRDVPPQGVGTSAPPPTYPSQDGARSRAPAVIWGVAAAFLLTAIGIGATAHFSRGPAALTTEGSSTPSGVSSGALGSSAPPPSLASPFILHVQSTPTGAVVTEDDVVLGTTPLDVKIDRETIGGGRSFQIKKDGFVPATITQGTTDSDRVEQVVSLAPEVTKNVKSDKPAGATKTRAVKGPGDDIRLKR